MYFLIDQLFAIIKRERAAKESRQVLASKALVGGTFWWYLLVVLIGGTYWWHLLVVNECDAGWWACSALPGQSRLLRVKVGTTPSTTAIHHQD